MTEHELEALADEVNHKAARWRDLKIQAIFAKAEWKRARLAFDTAVLAHERGLETAREQEALLH